jgi:monooxygenase
VDKKIRYDHRVRRASWSSADALWTVEAEAGPEKNIARFTCNFLYLCTGYYDYEAGYTPEWPGVERFVDRSCTRRSGPNISTTPASASS